MTFTASDRHRRAQNLPASVTVETRGQMPPLIITYVKSIIIYNAHQATNTCKLIFEKKKILKNLHHLWLGRGTHCHHLVCNLKEESQSQYNVRKKKPLTLISSVGQKQATGITLEMPVGTLHTSLNVFGPARDQQPPPGHQRAIQLGQYTQVTCVFQSLHVC